MSMTSQAFTKLLNWLCKWTDAWAARSECTHANGRTRRHTCIRCGVGQYRVYTLYMIVFWVNSLPETYKKVCVYICIYMVLANPVFIRRS